MFSSSGELVDPIAQKMLFLDKSADHGQGAGALVDKGEEGAEKQENAVELDGRAEHAKFEK